MKLTSNQAYAMQWARNAVQVKAITNQYYAMYCGLIPLLDDFQAFDLGQSMFDFWHAKQKQIQVKQTIRVNQILRQRNPVTRPLIP